MGNSLKILVMDAREDVAAYLTTRLPNRDFDIKKISDLDDGLAAARDPIPELILLNGDDPAGISLARQLKEDPELAEVPLVMMAEGRASEALVEHWFSQTPADYYVHRPLSDGFLDEYITGMFASAPSAAKAATKAQPTPVTPNQGNEGNDSFLVKALTDQLAALDKEVKRLRSQVADSGDSGSDGAAVEAQAQAHASALQERDRTISDRDKALAALEETLERQRSAIETAESRISEIESTRAQDAENASKTAEE